jgi:hypothetical protein
VLAKTEESTGSVYATSALTWFAMVALCN